MSIKKYFTKRQLRDQKASDHYCATFNWDEGIYDDDWDVFFWDRMREQKNPDDEGYDLYYRYMFPNNMEDLKVSKFITFLQKLNIKRAVLEDDFFI